MSLTCYTFSNRIFGCSYYKEEDNYAKTLRLTLEKMVVEYKECGDSGLSHSFYNIFINNYQKRKSITADDREVYEDVCLDCASNLSTFFRTYNPTNLLDKYIYRHRINGYIGCRIQREQEFNVDFSMRYTHDAFYELYYNRFNNWLYNTVNGTSNDMIVFVIPSNKYYILRYNEDDYTILHGFLRKNMNQKVHRPGHQCITCKVKHCMPRLVNNIERL